MSNYHILRSGDFLEQFRIDFNKSAYTQKYITPQLEICEYRFQKGARLHISAVEHDEHLKSYTIMDGKCFFVESATELGADDIVVVRKSDSFVTLHFLEPTTILIHSVNHPLYHMSQKNSKRASALIEKIQAKDHYTGQHCLRVSDYVFHTAVKLGYKGNPLRDLVYAARYHDIGKVHVDEFILNKPGTLSPEEYSIMKRHVPISDEELTGYLSPYIEQVISEHHERMDGSGYPKGLSGDEISEGGRLLAICDSYDAMVTDRIYKKGKSPQDAVLELQLLSDEKYDRRLVEVFIEVLKELGEVQ